MPWTTPEITEYKLKTADTKNAQAFPHEEDKALLKSTIVSANLMRAGTLEINLPLIGALQKRTVINKACR